MLQRIRQAVRRDNKCLLLAAMLSGGFFVGKLQALLATPHLLARQSVMTALLFLGLFITFRAFSATVDRHVTLEMVDGEEANRRLVRLFVIYKEVVKTVVGVSLTLGWLAGLLFISENFGGLFVGAQVLIGCAVSLLLFGVADVFTKFVDHIHYPH